MSDRISNQRPRPTPIIARMPRIAHDRARTTPWVARLAERDQFGRRWSASTLMRQIAPMASASGLLSRLLQRNTRHVLRAFSGSLPLITRLYSASDDDQAADERVVDGWPRTTPVARAALPALAATPTLARVAAAPSAMATLARMSRTSTALNASQAALSPTADRPTTNDDRPANELSRPQAALPMLLARRADPRAPLPSDGSSGATRAMLAANYLRAPAFVQRAAAAASSAGSTAIDQRASGAVISAGAPPHTSADTRHAGSEASTLPLRGAATIGRMQRMAAASSMLARSIRPTADAVNVPLVVTSPQNARLQRSEEIEQQTAGSVQRAPWSLMLGEQRSAPGTPQALLSRVLARTAAAGTTANALTHARAALPMLTSSLPALVHRLAVQPASAEVLSDAPDARAFARAADLALPHSQPTRPATARTTSQGSAAYSGATQPTVAQSALPVQRTGFSPILIDSLHSSTPSLDPDVSQSQPPSSALPRIARPIVGRMLDDPRHSLRSLQRSFTPRSGLLNRMQVSELASGDGLAVSSVAQRTPSVLRVSAANALPLVRGLAAATPTLEPSFGRTDVSAVPDPRPEPALHALQRSAAIAQRVSMRPGSAVLPAVYPPVQPRAETPLGVLARASLDHPDRRAIQTIGLPMVARTAQFTGASAPHAAGTSLGVLARASLDHPDRRAAQTTARPIVERQSLPFAALPPLVMRQQAHAAAQEVTAAARAAQFVPTLLQPMRVLHDAAKDSHADVKAAAASTGVSAAGRPTLASVAALQRAPASSGAVAGAFGVSNVSQTAFVQPVTGDVASVARAALPFVQRRRDDGALTTGAMLPLTQPPSIRASQVTGDVASVVRAALPFVQRWRDDGAPTTSAAVPFVQPPSARAPQVMGDVAPTPRAALPFVQRRGVATPMIARLLQATASIQRQSEPLGIPRAAALDSLLVSARANVSASAADPQLFAPSNRASISRYPAPHTLALLSRFPSNAAARFAQAPETGDARGFARHDSWLEPAAAPFDTARRSAVEIRQDSSELGAQSRSAAPLVARRWLPPTTNVTARHDSSQTQATGDQSRAQRSASRAPIMGLRAFGAGAWLAPAPAPNTLQRLALLKPMLAWDADVPAASVQRVEQSARGASPALAQRTGSLPMLAHALSSAAPVVAQHQRQTAGALAHSVSPASPQPLAQRVLAHSVSPASPQPLAQRVASLSIIAPARADVRRLARTHDLQPTARLEAVLSAQSGSAAQSYGGPTNALNVAASQQRSALPPALGATMQRAGGQSAPSLAAGRPFIARAPLLSMDMRAGSSTSTAQPEHIQPSTFGLINRLPPTSFAASASERLFAQPLPEHIQPSTFGLINRLLPTSFAAPASERLFAQPLLAQRSASFAPHPAADEPRDRALAPSSAFLPVQRAPQSSGVARVNAPVVDRSAQSTSAFLPFVQRHSANLNAASVVERGFAAPPSLSLVQRASARAEGSPAAFSAAQWRTSNEAAPQALSGGIIQPMWADQSAPLLRSFSPVVQRASEAHAPSAPPAFASRSAAMQPTAFTQATRRDAEPGQAPLTQRISRQVQRAPDTIARMHVGAGVDRPQVANTLLRRAQPVPAATADVRASVGGSQVGHVTRLPLGSIQRAPDLAADVRASVGGSQVGHVTRLPLGSIQRAPDLAAGVRANIAAGAAQRLSRVERSASLPLPLDAGPTAWQRTPTVADARPATILPVADSLWRPGSAGAAARALDDRATSATETNVGAAARAISRAPLRALGHSVRFDMLQRHQSGEQAPNQALDTPVASGARWFHQPLAVQSPQINRAIGDRVMPFTARQGAPASQTSRVSRQPSNRFAPLAFISRQAVDAPGAALARAVPQPIGGWLPSLATTGAATQAQRLPAANSVFTSADQRSPVGTVMRASFAWIARRADALTARAPNQPPGVPASETPSFDDVLLPLLDQGQASAPFDSQAANRSAPTSQTLHRAAAAPLDMLRPQRAVVQRSTSDEDATPSSTYVPDVNTVAPAASDVEALARQVYARLRQRLMLDAERLGR